MKQPLISVYIPTHNRVSLLLDRALPSVLSQTYRNIEIVVVAHGCTDGTEDAVRAFAEDIGVLSIPRVVTYPPTPENHWFAGRVAPANAALDACLGDWIATIDDDDSWEADCLESLLSFALEGDYEFVSAAGRNHKGRIEPYDLDGVKVGPIQTWLYKRYLKQIKFNPDCWKNYTNKVCDTDLQQRFRDKGVRMGYLDKILVSVIPRPGETEVGFKAAMEHNRFVS